jgi:hypothetical protein
MWAFSAMRKAEGLSLAATSGERVISFEYMMRIAYHLQVKPADLYKQIPVPNRMPKKGEYKGQKKSGTKKAPL